MSHPFYEYIIDTCAEDDTKMEGIPFGSVLGLLLYPSTWSSPDISTDVNLVAKFQSKPTLRHWKMLKDVVRYLIGTK